MSNVMDMVNVDLMQKVGFIKKIADKALKRFVMLPEEE